MARIRTIKPEFFTSEDIVEMPPLARLLYIALWCEADKEGRFAWKPKTFKMRYLPADDCDIDAIADAILTRGLIVTYDDGLAVIPSFKNHQHINPREKDSTLPAPRVEDLTRRARVSDEPVTCREEGRKEGKGKEGRERTCPAQEPDAPLGTEPIDLAKKPKRRQGTAEDHTAARWMFDLVKKVNATAKAPNYDIWADEVRLMREIDERTHAEICELFQWAKRDSFWCANIQSPAKLREKWDQLTDQRARPAKQQHASQPNQKFNFESADRSGDKAAMAASMKRHNVTTPIGDVDL